MRNSSIAPSHVVNILSRGFSLGKKTFYSSHCPLCRPHKLRIQAREPGRAGALRGGGGLPAALCLALGFSLPCLPLQIDVSEDDIDDGFRRLFAQLAGEVGVPQGPAPRALADAKGNMVFVLRGASAGRGEETKGTEAERICSRDGSAPSRRPSPAPSPGLRLSWGRALGSSASPGALAFLFSVRPN